MVNNMITYEITNEQGKILVDSEIENTIKTAIKTVAEEFAEGIPLEISVTFTDNDGIKDINKEYRNIDKETDVLSFPQLEYDVLGVIKPEYMPISDIYPSVVLGDIVLSLEKAESQAMEYGHSFLREVGYLTVHSMLHLFGFDHMIEEDKFIMREKEEEIMEKIGLMR